MERLLPGLQLPAEEVLHFIKYPVFFFLSEVLLLHSSTIPCIRLEASAASLLWVKFGERRGAAASLCPAWLSGRTMPFVNSLCGPTAPSLVSSYLIRRGG